jgi:hypothetical protein
MNKMLLASTKNFKRDASILLLAGILEYIIDYSTSKDLYKDCKNLKAQSFILMHHIVYIFTIFSWFSNNIYILFAEMILILGMFIHWKKNNNVCKWTESTQKQCNNNEYLRTFGRMIFKGVSDDDRKLQKSWLTIAFIISMWKITNYFRSIQK